MARSARSGVDGLAIPGAGVLPGDGLEEGVVGHAAGATAPGGVEETLKGGRHGPVEVGGDGGREDGLVFENVTVLVGGLDTSDGGLLCGGRGGGGTAGVQDDRLLGRLRCAEDGGAGLGGDLGGLTDDVDLDRGGSSDLSLSASCLDEVGDFLFEQGTEHLTGHGLRGGGWGNGGGVDCGGTGGDGGCS
jgi:hypothetical protein